MEEGRNAPRKISSIYFGKMASAVDENCMYVLMEHYSICAYNVHTLAWSQLPDSEYDGCALAIANGFLTLIGGISNAYH